MTINRKKTAMLVVVSIAIVAAISGTAATSLVAPVFAGGDEKKCKGNGDNNCNDTHKTQKIREKNYCEIENTNKDHSSDNENLNELDCINDAQNLKDVEQIFGLIAEPLQEEDTVEEETAQ